MHYKWIWTSLFYAAIVILSFNNLFLHHLKLCFVFLTKKLEILTNLSTEVKRIFYAFYSDKLDFN